MAATTSPPRRPRVRIRFELDLLEMSDGHLVVSGRWHGVRGLRFVRPTLILDGDEVPATLEHKPWPADADPWVAQFPWEHGRTGPERAALSVAPSVTVPLAWPGDRMAQVVVPAGPDPAELEDRLLSLQAERDSAVVERDSAVAERDSAVAERDGVIEAARDLRRRLDESAAEQVVLRGRIKRLEAARGSEIAPGRRGPGPEPSRSPGPVDERPIGTRAVTAADFLSSQRKSRRDEPDEMSPGERTATWLFASAASLCAFLLLVSLLQLFA